MSRLVTSLRIAHLYPDLMSVYGDRGNVLALVRRAEWRGLTVERGRGEHRRPAGPAGRRPDLLRRRSGPRTDGRLGRLPPRQGLPRCARRSPRARRCWRSAAATSCSGTQLHHRRRRASCPARTCSTYAACPGPKRHIGNVLVETELDGIRRTLVGFENHSGRTYLGAGVRPLGRTLVGAGNNGEDGTEGAVVGNAYRLLPARLAAARRTRGSPTACWRRALAHRTGEPATAGAARRPSRRSRPTAPSSDAYAAAGGRVESGAW